MRNLKSTILCIFTDIEPYDKYPNQCVQYFYHLDWFTVTTLPVNVSVYSEFCHKGQYCLFLYLI